MSTILARGMRPVILGLAIGLSAALIASRVIASELFQVAPWDPLVFAAVITLLSTIALAACWRPARRAARMDPMEALRCE